VPHKPQRHRTSAPAPVVAPVVAAPTISSASPSPAASQEPRPKPTKPAVTVPAVVVPNVTPTTLNRTADVSVRLTFSLRVGPLTPQQDGLLGYLNAGVSGIPTGQQATITVRVFGGRLVQRGSGCRPSGAVATCAVGPGAPPLEFNVMGLPIRATATVTVPSGWTDPVPANNQDSVLLGLL
jgi:hypothetical protein